MGLRLRWDPVPGDWADAVRVAVPAARWSRWFAAALGAFSAVLLVLGHPLPGGFGLGCAVVVAALPALAARRAFRSNPVAGRTVTADADEHGIRMMTLDGTAYSDLALGGLAGWAETERSFVLRAADGGMHPVPGRAFSDTADIDAFRELLRRGVGPADDRRPGARRSRTGH